MLYGEARDPDDPDSLHLAPNWGTNNPEVIETWFHTQKIQDHHKAELGMNQTFHDPEAGFGSRNIQNVPHNLEQNPDNEEHKLEYQRKQTSSH